MNLSEAFINDLDTLLRQARTSRAADIDAAQCNTPTDHERSRKERRNYDALREAFIEAWSPPSDTTLQEIKATLADALAAAKGCNASLDNTLASMAEFNRDLKERINAEKAERL